MGGTILNLADRKPLPRPKSPADYGRFDNVVPITGTAKPAHDVVPGQDANATDATFGTWLTSGDDPIIGAAEATPPVASASEATDMGATNRAYFMDPEEVVDFAPEPSSRSIVPFALPIVTYSAVESRNKLLLATLRHIITELEEIATSIEGDGDNVLQMRKRIFALLTACASNTTD